MRRSFGIILLTSLLTTAAQSQTVHVASVYGSINPAVADYLHAAVVHAAEANAECLIIRLNTPGGLLQSTREIVSDFLTSPVPIVVYVSPSGGQSASAGAFITLAAHVAAMAPGTNIGAAHPVGMQGDTPDSIMNEKATNDAAAFIKTISEKRHRNVRWAQDAVRKSISITETEARRDSVIDFIAASLPALLDSIDGRIVAVDGGTVTVRTRGAEVIEFEMSWRQEILNVLSDPNIAYILLLLGVYGLLFELYSPGAVLPGVVGAICLILAFYSVSTLPVNYAGLALIAVGIVLFLLEIKITSYGLLSIGGVIALFFGSIMLIETDSPLEFISISWSVIIPAIVCTGAFFLFAVGMGIRAQRMRPVTGVEGIVGTRGKTISVLNPEGQVMVRGEIWNATSTSGKLPTGTDVTVESIQNLRLFVRRQE
jgi:membrane-bound serine protease (ClpP class)